jgi:hypothetical protein
MAIVTGLREMNSIEYDSMGITKAGPATFGHELNTALEREG